MVSRSLRGVNRFAFPPAIYLQKPEAAKSAGPGSNDTAFQQIFAAVLPGMAAFALFFLATGLMADVFRERSLGTLARQLTAPVRATEVVIGKISATIAVGLLVAAGMALVGGGLLQARANLGAFALLCLAFLLSVTGFVTLLYSFARNEQQGGTLAAIVMMVMAFLGGSFIPLEGMPPFVARIAPLTLNYWAIRGFRTLLLSRAGLAEVAAPLAVMLVTGVVCVLAGGALLQRRLMRGA
jgi:ABC-2 type transport system permease protein